MNTLFSSPRSLVRHALCALGVAVALAAVAPNAEAQRTRPAPAASAEAARSSDGVVNIQTATVEQLVMLPGIGPSKAQAIVAHRSRHAFRRVEDIMRVRGVGRATFRRLRPMLTVDGPTTLSAPTRAPRQAASAAAEDED
ncbi:MAG: helix-hairpin-helix domain-containing protein [Sandaracinaceae bacterium]|nr:helix-hairpin-helix domain-containing protein [Sandaracinaceae bacterium]